MIRMFLLFYLLGAFKSNLVLFFSGRSVPRKQPTSSVKYRGSPGGGEGGGKPRRMRPGEKALKEIRFYQRHTGANDHSCLYLIFHLTDFLFAYTYLLKSFAVHALFCFKPYRAIDQKVTICKIS